MPQSAGAPRGPGGRIGLYEILGPLGAGGMGQVYRARDTRLERDVALKVLPEGFAADPDRIMRFTREARTLAALNHPNIAHVYDAGREGATAFIAMELVEGEDLSARISRRPIPVLEALRVARQIADALAAAHEAGIVHRDLKPANIKLTDDGVVKVLDFGLARAHASGSADPGLLQSGDSAATMTSPAMTAMGVILGTAAYMSPEQAKGKPVDRRADVWAFGVVLYEMLTGAFLFGREDVTDTLAAVLTHEPDIAKLPPATPPPVRRLIERCLAKDRKQRLDSMTVARIELEEVLSGKAAVAAAPGSPRRLSPARVGALLIAGVAAGVLGTVFYYSRRPGAALDSPPVVAQIAAPLETISAFHDGFALSANGSTLAFAARNTAGVRQIWIRSIDAEAARAIPGTDGGTHPFWSPDGGSVAFFAGGRLKRADVDGGRLLTICDSQSAYGGGSWNARGEILWSGGVGNEMRVFKVPAEGGAPTPYDALGYAYGPTWLSDGERFLFLRQNGTTAELRLASAEGQASDPLATIPRGTKEYAYGGGVVFLNRNDTLSAERLDEATGSLVGAAVPIAPIAGNPKDWFAVSSDGDRVVALVRRSPNDTGDPGDPMARLIWADRQGNTVGSLGDPGRYWTMSLGPDGRSAVVNPGPDLWLLRPDGRHTRLTTGGSSLQSWTAIWKPDGSELVYLQLGELVRRSIDPQSEVRKLANASGNPYAWSNDGRWLLLGGRSADTSTTSDILVYDLENGTARPWLATEFAETHPRLSPDDRWVAYASNVSGRQEVYIRSFEGSGQPIAVSTDGGQHPFWRGDGNELFFLAPGDDVMAVTLARSGTTIVPGRPQRLFRIPLNDITRGSYAPYAAAPDGQRFLLNVPDRPTPLFFLQGLRGMLGP